MILSKFLDPKNDVAFKKIFGSEKNKDILIHFINDILDFQEKDKIIEVKFLSPFQAPEIAYKKESIVDVLCKNEKEEQIIIEMQTYPFRCFEKRAQYYASKAYCGQLNEGQGEDGVYISLKQVIFIAICDHQIFKKKSEYLSHHLILDKKTYAHDLKDFSFSFIELSKFPIREIKDLKTIVEKWCYFFKYAKETKEADLDQIIGSDLIIKNAYEALNQFNWTENELQAYEAEKKRIWDNKDIEAQLVKTAKEEGWAQGKAQGKAEGKAEGRAQVQIEIAKKLLAKNQSIEDIIECTGLSLAEMEAIKSKQ